jgi:hypothetical protein
MGRVPACSVLLLEDLDAAFVRSTTREVDDGRMAMTRRRWHHGLPPRLYQWA